jgi:hypothetical protein
MPVEEISEPAGHRLGLLNLQLVASVGDRQSSIRRSRLWLPLFCYPP